MRTKEDLRSALATMIHDFRDKQGLSKAAIAKRLNVDDHTWNSWETGRTSPSVIDFVTIFESCGESMMRQTLQFIYPDQYKTGNTETRARVTRFIEEVATDHAIDIMAYLLFGVHGSNVSPQLELMCAYNHLPMEQRFMFAELVYTAFLADQHRGDLLAPDNVMPDMPVWEDGLKKAQKATYRKLQSYTTITE